MKNFNDFLKKQLEDPAVKTEYQKIDPHYQVAKAVIKLRVKRGVTQKELALRIGSTQAVVSRIESGAVNCSIETIQKISEALDAKLMIQIEPNEVARILEEFQVEPIKFQERVKENAKVDRNNFGNGVLPGFAIRDWDIHTEYSINREKETCVS